MEPSTSAMLSLRRNRHHHQQQHVRVIRIILVLVLVTIGIIYNQTKLVMLKQKASSWSSYDDMVGLDLESSNTTTSTSLPSLLFSSSRLSFTNIYNRSSSPSNDTTISATTTFSTDSADIDTSLNPANEQEEYEDDDDGDDVDEYYGTADEIMENGDGGNDIDGEYGKAYDINLTSHTFRFLKREVLFDKVTEKRQQSWFDVKWNNTTRFYISESMSSLKYLDSKINEMQNKGYIKTTKRRKLSKSSQEKRPIVGIFRGFDDENLQNFKAGKSFKSDELILRPDLNTLPIITPTRKDGVEGVDEEDRQYNTTTVTEVSAWFTPTSKYVGTMIIHSRNSNNSNVVQQKATSSQFILQAMVSAEDFALKSKNKNNYWEVEVYGHTYATFANMDVVAPAAAATADGDGDDNSILSFHGTEIRMFEPKKLWHDDDDDPNLPRVLSVGDSISMNYEIFARKALQGIANYHRIEDNSWSTARGMSYMEYWMGDYLHQKRWDVIHFNSGMHDLKKKRGLYDKSLIPIPVYQRNLQRQIEIMKLSNATLIFATTTPVVKDYGNKRYGYRCADSEIDYNIAALEVLKNFSSSSGHGIYVNDLAQAIYDNRNLTFRKWYKTFRDIHFHRPKEQEFLGNQVAIAIRNALEK